MRNRAGKLPGECKPVAREGPGIEPPPPQQQQQRQVAIHGHQQQPQLQMGQQLQLQPQALQRRAPQAHRPTATEGSAAGSAADNISRGNPRWPQGAAPTGNAAAAAAAAVASAGEAGEQRPAKQRRMSAVGTAPPGAAAAAPPQEARAAAAAAAAVPAVVGRAVAAGEPAVAQPAARAAASQLAPAAQAAAVRPHMGPAAASAVLQLAAGQPRAAGQDGEAAPEPEQRPAVAGSLAGTLLARCQQPWAEVEGLTASLMGRYLAAYCQLTNDRQMEEQRAAVQALAAAPGQAAAVALCAMIRGLLGDA